MSAALRLAAARAAAWALLVAGWVGLGSFALVLADGIAGAYALVALWLLLLGAAAALASGEGIGSAPRRTLLALCAATAAGALLVAPGGRGLAALALALLAWAALTALASGVVRGLRQRLPTSPEPPVAAAAIGALVAALALGDLADLHALALRLALLLAVAATLLVLLHPAEPRRPGGRRCRAGLFDCSLPAWPAGAWRDATSWPTLLAGLAMLPMMATLPLMAAWCRSDALPPQTVVLLHIAAMFAPALLLRGALRRWTTRRLALACLLFLAAGAVAALLLPAPWHLLVLAVAHGAAWGLAWAGQLWAPDRRSRDGASPARAAVGYALLTLAFGFVVAHFGEAGVVAAHVALALLAGTAWACAAAARHAAAAAAPPTSCDAGIPVARPPGR